jgi:hypothetical protein
MAPKQDDLTTHELVERLLPHTQLMVRENVPYTFSKETGSGRDNLSPSSHCQLLIKTTRHNQGLVVLLGSLPSAQGGSHHHCSMIHVNRFLP